MLSSRLTLKRGACPPSKMQEAQQIDARLVFQVPTLIGGAGFGFLGGFLALRHTVNKIQQELKDLARKDTVEKIERELKGLASSRAVEKIEADLKELAPRRTVEEIAVKLEKTNDALKELSASHQSLHHSVGAMEKRFEETLGRETHLATQDYISEVVRRQTERFERLIAPGAHPKAKGVAETGVE
jgi:uncharacterized membrane protein YheB (UPF0754 family)